MNVMTQYHAGAKRKSKPSALSLTWEEKRKILEETNLTALHVLMFYLSAMVKKYYIITDEKTAKSTGFTLRQVQDARRLLSNKNLFYETKIMNNENTLHLYCALKEGVYSIKYFDRLFKCKTLSEIYKKFNKHEINKTLTNSNLTTMEIDDINKLLDDFHKKAKGTKGINHKW